MRTLRSICIAGFILGILFKTLHWPGANVLLQASSFLVIGTLSLLLFQKRGPWTVQLPRPAMLVGSVIAVIIGGLFKVMYWPGANMLLLVGLSVCAAWFLITPLRSLPKTA
ncbi:MAG TPA: hypothetical protein PK760_02365 [Flavobacteriales bacterium]|nr:hypothetical protein [Flavobacteriales bacterium]